MADPNLTGSDSPTKRPLPQRLLGFPSSRTGWWAVILFVTLVVLMVIFRILVRWGQRGFFSNPFLAVTILAAGASAVAGAVAGVYSVARKGERALLVFFTILWNFIVIVFALGEIGVR